MLTARAWHEKGLAITEDFVNSHQLPVDQIVISGLYTDKKSKHIGKFEGGVFSYVDDSIHHIHDFVEQGVSHTYLINRPWNVASTLPRISNFDEFKVLTLDSARPTASKRLKR